MIQKLLASAVAKSNESFYAKEYANRSRQRASKYFAFVDENLWKNYSNESKSNAIHYNHHHHLHSPYQKKEKKNRNLKKVRRKSALDEMNDGMTTIIDLENLASSLTDSVAESVVDAVSSLDERIKDLLNRIQLEIYKYESECYRFSLSNAI